MPEKKIINISDEDDEQEEGSAGGAAKKKKPEPKAKKAPPPKKDKGAKAAKGKGKGKGGVFLAIFMILLMAAGGAAIFLVWQFNPNGTRDKFFEAVNSLDPAYVTLEEKEERLSKRESDIAKRENAAITAEAKLEQQRRELSAWQEELAAQQLAATPIYRAPMNEEDLANMTSLSKVYASMTPASAASILARLYRTDHMAAILHYMTEAKAAAIMSELEVGLAADITETLLH